MPKHTEVLEGLVDNLLKMPKAGFDLFLRRENFEPVGIMTSMRSEETSKGTRRWAMGVKIEEEALNSIYDDPPKKWTIGEATNREGFFAEPLDRWNPSLSSYEPVFFRNQYGLLVTARRSNSDEDEEENFRFFSNPQEIEEKRRNEMEVIEKETSISSLSRELDAKEKELKWWKNRAEGLGEQIDDYESRINTLSKKVYLYESMVEAYRMEARVTQGISRQVESAVRKILQDAEERGIDMARSDAERATQAARRMKQVREELGTLEVSGDSIDENLTEMKGKINNIEEKISEAGKKVNVGGEEGE